LAEAYASSIDKGHRESHEPRRSGLRAGNQSRRVGAPRIATPRLASDGARLLAARGHHPGLAGSGRRRRPRLCHRRSGGDRRTGRAGDRGRALAAVRRGGPGGQSVTRPGECPGPRAGPDDRSTSGRIDGRRLVPLGGFLRRLSGNPGREARRCHPVRRSRYLPRVHRLRRLAPRAPKSSDRGVRPARHGQLARSRRRAGHRSRTAGVAQRRGLPPPRSRAQNLLRPSRRPALAMARQLHRRQSQASPGARPRDRKLGRFGPP